MEDAGLTTDAACEAAIAEMEEQAREMGACGVFTHNLQNELLYAAIDLRQPGIPPKKQEQARLRIKYTAEFLQKFRRRALSREALSQRRGMFLEDPTRHWWGGGSYAQVVEAIDRALQTAQPLPEEEPIAYRFQSGNLQGVCCADVEFSRGHLTRLTPEQTAEPWDGPILCAGCGATLPVRQTPRAALAAEIVTALRDALQASADRKAYVWFRPEADVPQALLSLCAATGRLELGQLVIYPANPFGSSAWERHPTKVREAAQEAAVRWPDRDAALACVAEAMAPYVPNLPGTGRSETLRRILAELFRRLGQAGPMNPKVAAETEQALEELILGATWPRHRHDHFSAQAEVERKLRLVLSDLGLDTET